MTRIILLRLMGIVLVVPIAIISFIVYPLTVLTVVPVIDLSLIVIGAIPSYLAYGTPMKLFDKFHDKRIFGKIGHWIGDHSPPKFFEFLMSPFIIQNETCPLCKSGSCEEEKEVNEFS